MNNLTDYLVKLREKNNFVTKKYFYLPYFKLKNNFIPGMIKDVNGERLFLLAISQTLKGDIVEIGSWQGKSTSFLAKSIEINKNGKVYAIDHFKGNSKKTKFDLNYKVNKNDLSDLKNNFTNNMSKLRLNQNIKLLNMKSKDAVNILKTEKVKIRFLFIDGLHTYEGVKTDFELFYPLVLKGGIIVFDDYSNSCDGVKRFIDEIILKYSFKNCFYYENTFIIKL